MSLFLFVHQPWHCWHARPNTDRCELSREYYLLIMDIKSSLRNAKFTLGENPSDQNEPSERIQCTPLQRPLLSQTMWTWRSDDPRTLFFENSSRFLLRSRQINRLFIRKEVCEWIFHAHASISIQNLLLICFKLYLTRSRSWERKKGFAKSR